MQLRRIRSWQSTAAISSQQLLRVMAGDRAHAHSSESHDGMVHMPVIQLQPRPGPAPKRPISPHTAHGPYPTSPI
ncbi:Protein of unknown function [Pyronema omphalodes CBS 100304]|uniref:Uncharacterized protein n=1 Tax=Pyronema omphalodes (strain CBS 100304) TaxID=1076935 RepID=U4LFN7_PYROM|nr:Protein of unknown function [Pyronema omphalodes CBS 100304]